MTPTRRGFSMPEMLVGLAILAFTLGAGYSLLSSGVADVSHTRDFSTAVLLAQEAIEACRGYKFELLDETDPELDADENPTGAQNGDKSLEFDFNNDAGAADPHPHVIDIGGMKFTRTVVIDPVDRNIPAGLPAGVAPPPLKLKSVKVTLAWQTAEHRDVTYEVDTLVSAIYR